MKKTVYFVSFLVVIFCILAADLSWSATYEKKFVNNHSIISVSRDKFSVSNPSARYRLTVRNGENGQNRVSYALVLINGEWVLQERSSDDAMERNISLKPSNDLIVLLVGHLGSFITLTIECLDFLDVKIVSPVDGALIYTPSVVVKGTISAATDDVGVTINGFAAAISGEIWAGQVPLVEGGNIINVLATAGEISVQKSITVTAVPGEFIDLSAKPDSGIAPLSVTFTLLTSLDSPPTSAGSCQLDFEGDGVIDYQGQIFEKITHTYDLAGIYYPNVTLNTGDGKMYKAEAVVQVINKDKLDVLLRSRWDDMTTSLSNQDIEGALAKFADETRDYYSELFTAFGPFLPDYVSELKSAQISLVAVDGSCVDYEILVQRQGMTFSYPLRFIKDSGGIWKIWKY